MVNPAFLSAGVSLLGMAANAQSVRNTNETNIRLMRERNQAQAAANAEAWNREVVYNHPSAQVARMRAAGLNPNLLYQSAPMNTQNMVAPEFGAANAQAPFFDTSGIANSILNGANIQAQTAKTIAETNSIDLENKLKSATLGDDIKMANLNVRIGEKSLAYTDVQTAAVAKSLSKLDADIGYIKEQTSSVSQHRYVEMVELALKSKEVNAQIKNLEASSSLTRQQIVRLVKELPYLDEFYQYRNEESAFKSLGLRWDSAQRKLDYDINQDYEETMQKLGVVRGFIDFVGSILGGLVQTKKLNH